MNKPKIKGTAWETAIVRFLQDAGVLHAERRALNGSNDRGDIAGLPNVVIEAKDASRICLSAWLDEAHAERDNDNAGIGVVWAKRRGKSSPGKGYVVMDGETFLDLLRTAGYIPPLTPSVGGEQSLSTDATN